MPLNLTFNGREVRHPLGRVAVAAILVMWVPLSLLFGFVFLVIVGSVGLLVHPPLRLLGRRGTVRRDWTGTSILLDREAFRRW
jgi:hypothetical protein